MNSSSEPVVIAPAPHIPAHCRRVSADQHFDLIADAAYFLAQARGFAPGHDRDDWLQAEAQIRAKFLGDYYCDTGP
ncbi:MAG: hypothetical protein JWQ90_3664 [Hydrocarboniphaga sp.]|uniref:DUF2934 domain-containing protein n=1 Tax=Hydrocarboniphaga sp. TaxID=2033016 RepID=UPI002620AC8C|nr:DUF2934 domain-containing protein [Hydrocarboniphaga sp.]MDB5971214.1 hypothetical protein [Hydrocarboniphaga sp.]